MLFVDFTPLSHRGLAFGSADAMVLDHHEKQRHIVAGFGARGIYADTPGVSGAMLAFREVWQPMMGARFGAATTAFVERIAFLAGVRDTWQTEHKDWMEACAQAAALRFWPWELLRADGMSPLRLRSRLEIGPVLLARDTERDAATLATAHRTDFYGLNLVMFEGIHTSDIAERLGAEADVVLGWHLFDEDAMTKMTVSVRSRGSRFCAGDFAATQPGGGGHAGAAGFTTCIDYSEHPHAALERILGAYLRGSAGR